MTTTLVRHYYCTNQLNTLFLSDEGPMLETLDYTIRIGSTPTFLYLDLQVNTDLFFLHIIQFLVVHHFFKRSIWKVVNVTILFEEKQNVL